MNQRGALILVVGPSGAGKDTLIAAAQARRPDIHVPRRIITRPPEPDDEPSHHLSAHAFESLRQAGRLALDWQAHGLRYGLRGDIAARLRGGQTVLANVSRSVVAAARARYQPCRVVLVTAPSEILAGRLARRGREDAPAIAERLARAGHPLPPGLDLVVVENSGDLCAALERFMAVLPPAPACAA